MTTATLIQNKGVLTTEHPSSSYGVPVLIIGDNAYGPLDRVQGPLGECSAAYLVRVTPIMEMNEEKIALARKFMDVARMSMPTEFQRQSYDYLP